jgi:hypothetical protein
LVFRIWGRSPRYQGFDTAISQALVFLVSSGNSQLLYPLPRTLETPKLIWSYEHPRHDFENESREPPD